MRSPGPHVPHDPHSRRKLCRLSRAAVLAFLLAATLAYVLAGLTLPSSRLRPLGPPAATPCTHPPATDRLLHLIAAECARRQPTYISVTPQGTLHTSLNPPGCRHLELFLGPRERGFGMCTDVAFYVLHLGARIVPFSVEMFPQYNNTCQYPQTRARVHLETIYNEPLTGAPKVKNVMLVNSEHLFTFDAHKHPEMDLFVCKTRFCVEPMRQYIRERGLKAEVMYVGHSSLDPIAPIPPLPWETQKHPAGPEGAEHATAASSSGSADSGRGGGGAKGRRQVLGKLTAGVPGPGGVVKDYQRVLHVRGKSGLKHTQQILMCWKQQPDLPEITVVAFDYKLGSFVEFAGVPNIRFLPPIPANDTLAAQVLSARKELERVQLEPWLLDRSTFAHQFHKQYARQFAKQRNQSLFTLPTSNPAQSTPATPANPQPAATPATPNPAAARQLLLKSSRLWRLLWNLRGKGASTFGPALDDLQGAEEEAYQAAAADFRKRHDDAVTAAAKAVDNVIEAGPSVHGSISPVELQRLQLEVGIHMCASVREGFGHYINEARAAGALVVTTDHPPMNELVTADMGVLVAPEFTNSINLQSLGKIVNINAFLSPDQICAAAKKALSMSVEEKQQRGQRARHAYEQERCAFEKRLQELQALLMAGQ